jgi:hypothetical protein
MRDVRLNLQVCEDSGVTMVGRIGIVYRVGVFVVAV